VLVHCPKSLRVQHWQLTKDRANATKEDRALLVLERTQDSKKIIKHERWACLRTGYHTGYPTIWWFLMFPTCSHSNGSITLVFPSFSPNKAAILWVTHCRTEEGRLERQALKAGTSFTNGGSIGGQNSLPPLYHLVLYSFHKAFIKASHGLARSTNFLGVQKPPNLRPGLGATDARRWAGESRTGGPPGWEAPTRRICRCQSWIELVSLSVA